MVGKGWKFEPLPMPVEFLGWFLFYGAIFVVAKMFDDSDPQWGENHPPLSQGP